MKFRNNDKKQLVIMTFLILISLVAACACIFKKQGTEEDLIVAVQEGNLRKIKTLLKSGDLNVDTLIDGEKTLLFVAVKNGYEEVARFLIEKGANINAETLSEYVSVLTIACSPNKVKIREEGNVRHFKHTSIPANPKLVKYLIEKGANVNPIRSSGPLMAAVISQELEVCKILIEHGADER